jgi:hypothetical protein
VSIGHGRRLGKEETGGGKEFGRIFRLTVDRRLALISACIGEAVSRQDLPALIHGSFLQRRVQPPGLGMDVPPYCSTRDWPIRLRIGQAKTRDGMMEESSFPARRYLGRRLAHGTRKYYSNRPILARNDLANRECATEKVFRADAFRRERATNEDGLLARVWAPVRINSGMRTAKE